MSIGDFAFFYCTNLTSVNIGNKVKSIGYDAFFYCTNLTDVICFAEAVPSADNYAFDPSIQNATLHVPEASLANYKAKTPWNKFKYIVAIDSNTAINNEYQQDHSNKSFWYSLDGRKTAHPSKGIFIRNGKKEFIRSTR